MAVDERVFEIALHLRMWAASQPRIQRLWIFGSRLRGTQRPDSDLDIAIEIDRLDSDDAKDQWWPVEREWREKLRNLSVPLEARLEMFRPEIESWLSCCSMLVYARECPNTSVNTDARERASVQYRAT